MLVPIFVRTRGIDDILREIKKMREEDLKRHIKLCQRLGISETDALMTWIYIEEMVRRL